MIQLNLNNIQNIQIIKNGQPVPISKITMWMGTPLTEHVVWGGDTHAQYSNFYTSENELLETSDGKVFRVIEKESSGVPNPLSTATHQELSQYTHEELSNSTYG